MLQLAGTSQMSELQLEQWLFLLADMVVFLPEKIYSNTNKQLHLAKSSLLLLNAACFGKEVGQKLTMCFGNFFAFFLLK